MPPRSRPSTSIRPDTTPAQMAAPLPSGGTAPRPEPPLRIEHLPLASRRGSAGRASPTPGAIGEALQRVQRQLADLEAQMPDWVERG